MPTPPAPVEPWSHIVRIRDAKRETHDFDLRPDRKVAEELARRLDVSALRKLRFSGRLLPEGRRDWRIEAKLGATAVQSCVVTLAPVTTRIDEEVERRYLAELPALPEGEEIEMPDDAVEPLPATLDLGAIMAEALAIALPAWPRAEGVEFGPTALTEPGKSPLDDEGVRPLAGLRDLLNKGGEGE